MTVNVNEFANAINTDNMETAKKAAFLTFRIAAIILSMGAVGVILFKYGWPLVEFVLVAWFPLMLLLTLGVALGVITAETGNAAWSMIQLSSDQVKKGLTYSIEYMKNMKDERPVEKSL